MNFRAQYLDASAAIIRERDASAEGVADVIGLLADAGWPTGAVAMVVMSARGAVAARVSRDIPYDLSDRIARTQP